MIRTTLLASAIGIAALLTAPVHAGGPVLVEEPPQVEADTEDGRIPGWVVPAAVGSIVLLAIVIGSDTCNGDAQPTEPECQ